MGLLEGELCPRCSHLQKPIQIHCLSCSLTKWPSSLLTPWSTVLFDKLTVSHPVKTSPHLGNVNFHYPLQNSPQLVPILSLINPVYALPTHFFKTQVNNFLHAVRALMWFLSLNFFCTNTLYFCLYPYMPHAPHILFYHPVIFGEEYMSWSSSFCSFVHCPVTFSALGRMPVCVPAPFYRPRSSRSTRHR